ncbi:MAG: TPM domain-containing protein [Armatimonadetes bacterium]|nr:TPM domain-containing protein [Armatimonadota bacterium]
MTPPRSHHGFLLASLLIAGVSLVSAQRPQDVINPQQAGLGWVSDQAGVLSPNDEARLNALIDQF